MTMIPVLRATVLQPCRPINQIIGSAALGAVFVHSPNAIVAYTATLPSANSVGVAVRTQDASNYWNVYVTSAGAFGVSEVVANSGTNRANTNGAVATGDRVAIALVGTTLTGFVNGVQSWTYASATNFADRFLGSVFFIGADGAVNDLRTWTLPCRRMEGV